jgi:hypothetical protein
MDEIIFSYMHQRCHALKVKELPEKSRYIGELDGYEIYEVDIENPIFEQFAFIAVKKK